MDVKDKAAIVTGGGTGVGRATALSLAERGCDVLINYSRSKDAAEAVAEEARTHGVNALAVRADVSVDADCRGLVAAAEKNFGRLDVLINNAGTTRFINHADLEGVEDSDWDNIFGVNVKGPFQCARAARSLMAGSGGGDIVMTSSVAGLIGVGSCIPYAASKAALNNLTVTLARVLGPDIRVNAVAPGFIDGEWLQEGLGAAYEPIKQAQQAKSPLGKVVTPQDVADAILSLVLGSDLVTAHVLPIEAGMLIGG
jgi:3-oxoacyl-[acyl-carrier protein] reductase